MRIAFSILLLATQSACTKRIEGARQLSFPSPIEAAAPALVPQFLPDATVNAVTINEAGDRALLGDDSGTLSVVDLDRKLVTMTITPHRLAVAAVKIDARGNGFSVSRDGRICRVDIARARLVGCIQALDAFGAVEFSADGHFLVGVDFAGLTVHGWDLVTGQKLEALPPRQPGRVYEIAISDDGSTVAMLNRKPPRAVVWNRDNGTLPIEIANPVKAAFSGSSLVVQTLSRVSIVDLSKRGAAPITVNVDDLGMWREPDDRLSVCAGGIILANIRAMHLSPAGEIVSYLSPMIRAEQDDRELTRTQEDAGTRDPAETHDARVLEALDALLSGQKHYVERFTAAGGNGKQGILSQRGIFQGVPTTALVVWKLGEPESTRREVVIRRRTRMTGSFTATNQLVLGTMNSIFSFDLATSAVWALSSPEVRAISPNGDLVYGPDALFEVGVRDVKFVRRTRPDPTKRSAVELEEKMVMLKALQGVGHGYEYAVESTHGMGLFACPSTPESGCKLLLHGTQLEDAATGGAPINFEPGLDQISADARRALRAVRKEALDQPFFGPQKFDQGFEIVNTTNQQAMGFIRTDSNAVAVGLSPDNKRVAIVDRERTLKLFDVETGDQLATIAAPFTHPARRTDEGQWGDRKSRVAFSEDGRFAVTGEAEAEESAVLLYDLEARKLVRAFTGHRGPIDETAISPDQRHLLSIGTDGTARLWRIDSDASLVIAIAGTDWVMSTAQGWFDASRLGARLLAVVDDGQSYAIDQLAAQNNRPDLILEQLGLGTDETKAHFRARHQLRLRRLGLSEKAPDTSFEQAPSAILRTVRLEEEVAILDAELTSPTELASYQVFANGVPLFDGGGRPANGKRLTISERITLSRGTTRLELSARSVSGLESLRAVSGLLRPRGRLEVPRGNLYVVALGVSKTDPALNPLLFPGEDVTKLIAAMQRMEKKGGFDHVIPLPFVEEKVGQSALAQVRLKLKQATLDDTVVLMISGHGKYAPDAEGNFYFLPTGAKLNDLKSTAIPFTELEGLLADIRPRRKLLLIDSCEAGERDPSSDGSSMASGQTKGAPLIGGKVVSRPYLFNRDRFIYNDLARRTGALVFTASRGDEPAFEDPKWKNGAFTFEIIQALTTGKADRDRDGLVSTEELRAYVRDAVPRLTSGRQHPETERANVDAFFTFPIVPELK
ncbi:MAG: caspase family protein [Archangium sp.]|nr:caspase family protein [Archangium sp.]